MVAFLRFVSFATLAAAIPLGDALGDAENCSGEFAQVEAPEGAFVVDRSGKAPKSFPTFNSAVAALKNVTDEQTIFVHPGNYTEQIVIPKYNGPIVIQGYTCDSRTYAGNKATLSGGLSRTFPNITKNDQTAVIRISTPNVKMYNLNVENTFGQADKNGQALAISAQNTDLGFYACQFAGYQDTVLANVGRQLYVKSLIIGATDFIFGQKAVAWFESCDLKTIGKGYITANGRDSEQNPSYYVFNKANVTGTSGPASQVLGRPWKTFARVVFQNSELGDVIKPDGWTTWNDTAPTENVSFKEFQNTGPGAEGPRVNFSSTLTEAVKPVDLFGEGWEKSWFVDQSYF
ncbi:Pectinesterase [Colletotrichum trifolii]|uniref:Pectinesterase n=1 Tax=Colletotrichum trifolii TaxID=5466 RepID=A0A4R8RL90_COLTR|nr:Pectinesterase [Colletotrichum trifolii]